MNREKGGGIWCGKLQRGTKFRLLKIEPRADRKPGDPLFDVYLETVKEEKKG